MSAASSLSRLEFVLNSADPAHPAGAPSSHAGGGVASTLTNMMPSWMSGGSASGLPPPAGGSSSAAGSAAASASAAATAAAASATAAAHRVSSSANQWFNAISAKVQGKEPPPATGLVAVDLESGGLQGGGSEKSGLLSSDPGGASGSTGIGAQFQSELSALTTLTWQQRMMGFVMSLVVGVIMLFLAFSFLPMVFLGSPVKFAISYALSNLFLLGSSCFLVGPSKQLSQMFAGERFLPSTVYLASLVLLFYTAWQVRAFFVVVPVLVVQFASLAWYIMSYVPFGQSAMRRICGFVLPMITRQFSSS